MIPIDSWNINVLVVRSNGENVVAIRMAGNITRKILDDQEQK